MTSSKMDEELRKAAVRGDVYFLKKCVESNKPIEYYLTSYPKEDDQCGRAHHGNIFHVAARENEEEFIREAMGILPQQAKQQLLLQPRGRRGLSKYNPLHVAAYVGNVEIVMMFLDVYRCLPSHLLEHQRPWLLNNSRGNNPCFEAVFSYQEECALEIYKMDTELISNMPSARGSSLVFEAVHMKMSKLALEILRSPHPISCNDNDGFTPFHSIHNIEGSGIAVHISSTSALMAEILAILAASWAIWEKWDDVQFHSDCLRAVQGVNKAMIGSDEMENYYALCRGLISTVGRGKLSKASRAEVKEADVVARQAVLGVHHSSSQLITAVSILQ